jgi:hypothetical protein
MYGGMLRTSELANASPIIRLRMKRRVSQRCCLHHIQAGQLLFDGRAGGRAPASPLTLSSTNSLRESVSKWRGEYSRASEPKLRKFWVKVLHSALPNPHGSAYMSKDQEDLLPRDSLFPFLCAVCGVVRCGVVWWWVRRGRVGLLRRELELRFAWRGKRTSDHRQEGQNPARSWTVRVSAGVAPYTHTH